MKVAYVTHTAELSGGELALVRLVGALGPQVEPLVVLGADGPLVDLLAEHRIPALIEPLAPALAEVRVGSSALRSAGRGSIGATVAAASSTAALLRAHEVELVHTSSMKAHLYAGLAGRRVGVPVVWHCRDIVHPGYMGAQMRAVFRAGVRALPAGVIANSPSTLRSVRPGRRTPAVVAPSIIAARRRAAVHRDGGPLRIGILGRLVGWKGHELLLEALGRIRGEVDFCLEVAGAPLLGDPGWEAHLREVADRHGVGERVSWLGFVDDVDGLLAELDVVVSSSLIPEPFGQTVFEAMAAGLCVVAPDCGGPGDYCTDGRDSLLYPPGDAAGLAEALRHAAASPSLRAALGAEAQRTASQFTAERVVPVVLSLYEAVLARRGRGGRRR